jgi:hypothetical protein
MNVPERDMKGMEASYVLFSDYMTKWTFAYLLKAYGPVSGKQTLQELYLKIVTANFFNFTKGSTIGW